MTPLSEPTNLRPSQTELREDSEFPPGPPPGNRTETASAAHRRSWFSWIGVIMRFLRLDRLGRLLPWKQRKKEPDDSSYVPVIETTKMTELWKIYRDYTIHEDDLVDGRLQRMLAIHAFLFAVFGVIIAEFWRSVPPLANACAEHPFGLLWGLPAQPLFYDALALIVPATGILSSWASGRALGAAQIARQTLREKWARIGEGPGGRSDQLGLPGLGGGGSEKAIRLGEAHLEFLPRFFIIFWTLAVLLSLFLLYRLCKTPWSCPHPAPAGRVLLIAQAVTARVQDLCSTVGRTVCPTSKTS